ncbi:hypothetical protein ACFL0X_01445 [Nanoarchaeota archaeon]
MIYLGPLTANYFEAEFGLAQKHIRTGLGERFAVLCMIPGLESHLNAEQKRRFESAKEVEGIIFVDLEDYVRGDNPEVILAGRILADLRHQ